MIYRHLFHDKTKRHGFSRSLFKMAAARKSSTEGKFFVMFLAVYFAA